jgi:hypothetical protein
MAGFIDGRVRAGREYRRGIRGVAVILDRAYLQL